MKKVVASLGALKHRKQGTEADAAAVEHGAWSMVGGPHNQQGKGKEKCCKQSG